MDNEAITVKVIEVERIYCLLNFQKYILNFNRQTADKLVKNVKIDSTFQRFNFWRIFLKVIPDENLDKMVEAIN